MSSAAVELRSARHRSVPPASLSMGLEAVDLAASAGLDLDPWQQQVLVDSLGETAEQRWAAFEVALIVPRQNGKGAVLEARELAGLFLFEEQLILHSAHEFKTAAEAFRRVLALVESTPDLSSRVRKVRTSHGEEGIELTTGQRLRFVARSTGSGRGFSGDCVILDEAYNLSAKGLAALLPTMSARPNPQLWYTSSAPLDGPESDVLRRLCKRGRAGTTPNMAYFEHCAADDAPLDDEDGWADANPGLGIRIDAEFVHNELAALQPDDFARERLGIWFDPAEDVAERVIDPEAWARAQDPKSGPVGQVAFALDVSPSREWASFGVAGRSGRGGDHIEIVTRERGTAWLVARALELQSKWGGALAVAQGSPAWSLVPELETAGVKVLTVSTQQHAQACGYLFDGITEGTIRHLGQPELTAAVDGAARRFYGDAWLWSRKAAAVDITPLVSVTLALWASRQLVPDPAFIDLGELLEDE